MLVFDTQPVESAPDAAADWLRNIYVHIFNYPGITRAGREGLCMFLERCTTYIHVHKYICIHYTHKIHVYIHTYIQYIHTYQKMYVKKYDIFKKVER